MKRITKDNQELWFEEFLTSNECRRYKIKNIIYSGYTKFHKVNIYNLFDKGVSLVIDDHARVFEIDEFIFHEGFVHSLIARARNSCSVLVVGDGDGGLIRELIKHETISKIDWVEIDFELLELCQKFLPTFPRGFDSNPRVRLVVEDGFKFVRNSAEHTYDVILISVSVDEGKKTSDPLKGREFFDAVRKLIKPSGLVGISLEEYSPSKFEKYLERLNVVEQCFKFVQPFYIPLHSFGSNWGFALASNTRVNHPAQIKDVGLKFYDSLEDRRMFSIPTYLSHS